MSASNLSEITRELVLGKIRSDIAASLAAIRVMRADPIVTTEPPQSYFIYQSIAQYRTPAVFAIVEDMDFKKERGANHVNATVKINISVVVEDRLGDNVVIKAERYQAALYDILDEAVIDSSDNTLRVVVIVKRAMFSPVYMKDDKSQSAFRKEVLLECEVEHYENF